MPLKRNDVKKEAKIKYVVKIVRENDENQDGRKCTSQETHTQRQTS